MKKTVLLIVPLTLFLIQLQAQTIVRGPYLQKGSATSITIKWRTSAATESKIDYGKNGNNLNQTANDNVSKIDHELEINGLDPNTTYFYRVANAGGVLMPASNDLYFRTHPTIGSIQPINMWILGDCGTGGSKARSVRDAYYGYAGSSHTDAILMLGDNAYSDGTDAEYQNAVFENMYEDKLKNSILWSCLGNHDGHSASSNDESGPYYDIFTFPTSGESGGLASGTEAYYSFDYGNIHFISLNSHDSDRAIGGPMYVWAQNDIQNTTQDWIVAFWHHPAYSKGTHDSDTENQLKEMRANFVPMLENNGVDLVLSGHSHTYERSYFLNGHLGQSNTFNANTHTVGATGDGDGRLDGDGAYTRTTNGNTQNDGAVYITAGNSGSAGSGSLNHPAMFYSVSELGSCLLEVNGNQLNVKFLRENGNIDDYFTIKKEAINCTAGDPCNDGNPYTINDTYDSDCFCTGTVIGGSACLYINNGADDVEENGSGGVNDTSSDLELVFDGSDQTVGLRFNNVIVPQGATITQAYLQFTVDEISTNVTNLTIEGEDVNNAAPFSLTTSELSNRTKTSANVNWVPPAWNTAGASGLDQRTPDLSTIIKEIVDRPGYSQNNSIALFITGTGTRIAESYEGDPSGTQLCLTYTTGGCPVTGQSCDDGDPCTINDVINSNCICIGTFQDSDNDGVCDVDDQCPNFDNALIGTTCDDGDPNTTFDVYTTNCICEGIPITGNVVCRQISSGTDDAEENATNGYVNTVSSDIEMAFDLNDQICGFRFNAITIPQGATITSAHIQFQVDEADSGAASLTVEGESADNAATFVENTSDLSNRTKTTASVSWTPPDWNTTGASGPDQLTPDLSAIIQEIVNRPGFSLNNSIALFVTGTGTRTAHSYDGNNSGAAELCIEFSVGGGCTTTGQSCNDGNDCTINDVIDNDCNCIGTFQDTDSDGVCDADDQCPNFDDNLIGTTCDDGDPNTNNEVYTTNCICEGTPNTDNMVCRRIEAGIDDVEENTTNGEISTGSTDIELVFDGNDQIAGLRFNNITIPQGSSITSANLQFTADEINAGASNLTIQGEDADNASSFASTTNNLSDRTTTSAAVNWSPPDWNSVGEAGPDQLTPDLSTIIQEIVDRPGFNQDNSIALLITGTGERTAESYNGDVAAAALLCIEYSAPCTTTGQSCNDGNDCTINDVIDNDCNCIGTFQDTDSDGVCDADDQCPNFDDNLIGTTCDDGDPNTNNEVYTTNCLCEGTPNTDNMVCRRIGAGIDDVEENSTNGYISTGSSDIELVFDENDQIAGLRFNDISIPQGATITNANLQFTVDETNTGASNLTIHGEDTDNAASFTSTDNNLSDRTTTSAAVNWSPPDWNTVGEAGPDQQTPDLSSIIQEIVDRPGFNANNSIALLITGTGERTAESYNGDVAAAALLCIEYSMATPSVTYDLKVALEGAYDLVSGTMSNKLYTLELLPGMVFADPNNSGIETPAGQPYNRSPWNYPGTEGLTFNNSDYDPMSVDWVLLSLRTGIDATTEIHQAAGILKRDGTIQFLQGSAYQGNVPGPYFVLIEHRNHIGVLSPQALAPQNGVLVYDFTVQNSWIPSNGGFGQKELTPGFWGMFGGDGDQEADVVSYDINGADRILWSIKNGLFNQYEDADYDLTGEVTGADRILWNINSGISSGVPK